MTTVKYLIYIILLCPFLIWCQDEGARGSGAKKVGEKSGVKRALVVGVADYNASSLKLNYADDDAVIFKDYLLEVEKIPEERLVSLIAHDSLPTPPEEEPTSNNVLNELTKLMDETQQGDTVYFYFAGHGDVVVISVVTNKGAKFILTLDACRSGFLYKEGTQKNLETFNNNFQHSTKFFSCKPEQFSLESGDIGHGYFTYYLVLGLLGAADNLVQDNNLQFFELSAFLANNVYKETNEKQSPIVWTQYFNEVFIPVNSKYKDIALNTLKASSGIKDIFAARGFEKAITENLSEIPIVKQFNKALKSEDYYGTKSSALELYKKAKNENLVKESVVKRMRNSLVNALSTNSQILINTYIGNAEVLPSSKVFITKAKYLEICLDLLEKDAFNYDRLYMSQLFLEAYAIIRAQNYSKYTIAKQKLKQALEIEDRAAYIHNALGIVLNHEEKYKEAKFHYKRANELIPSWSFPINNIGINYYDQHRYKEGETYLLEAIKLRGSYGTALNNLGAISESQGKYTAAENYYHKVGESKGGYSETALRNLGVLYEKKGNIKKALEYYELALEKNPNDVFTFYSLSELLIDEGIDVKRAEELLKNAIELEPYFSRGHAEYADFLRRYPKNEDSYKETLDLYDFAISNNPFYEWAYAGKGWLFHKQDLKDEALKSFEKGIASNSNKPKSYYYLANYYKNGLKDNIKSEEYYLKAIEKDTFYLPAYENLVELYNKSNQEEKSLDVLNKLVTWNADAPDIWNLLGNTHFDTGDFQKAAENYQKAIEVDSTYAKGFSNLAYSLMKTGKYSDASKAYKKAVQYNPYKNKLESFASLLLTEARKQNRNGNKNNAKTILEEAYYLVSNHETSFALAEYYYLNNNAKEAIKIANSIEVDALSKSRKLKHLELLTKIMVDLNLKKESQEYFTKFKAISPRPNNVLEALVKQTNKDKKGAKETFSKANVLMLRDKFLSKKFSADAINKIKQLQK